GPPRCRPPGRRRLPGPPRDAGPAAPRRGGRDHGRPGLPSAQTCVPAGGPRMTSITALDVHDVRFPTAAAGDGSDAINRGDYSATYVELRTDGGPVGAGLTFTNGRGN